MFYKTSLFVLFFLVALTTIVVIDIATDSPVKHISQQSLPKQQQKQPEEAKPSDPIRMKTPDEKELETVHVPIAKINRVFNYTSVQCVWATIETLGNHNGSAGTYRITDRRKRPTFPLWVSIVLNRRGVNYLQCTRRGIQFLDRYVRQDKFGCGISINMQHMLTVCHFDYGKEVKVIDNSDEDLKIQTWTWKEFLDQFDGWALVIFPDNYSNDYYTARLYPNFKLYDSCKWLWGQ